MAFFPTMMFNTQLYLIAATMIMSLLVAQSIPQAKPGCQEKCGDLVIPFPFGIGEGCFMQPEFSITCENSTIAKLSNNKISNFSILNGELQVMQDIALDCYDKEGNETTTLSVLELPPSYTISTRNEFFTLGCNAIGLYSSGNNETGINSPVCFDFLGDLTKSCTGIGCSQTSIPTGMQSISFTVVMIDDFNATDPWQSKYPCSYAFIVEDGNFTFDPESSFQLLETPRQQLPVVVDWAVGNQSCEEVVHNLCQENASCADRNATTEGMVGYICQCAKGYDGNPYLGCQDINECMTHNICENGICKNLPGNYTCECNEGFTNVNGTCTADTSNSSSNTSLKTALGICIGFLGLVVLSWWIYWGMSKRKLERLKEKHFKENGGLTLQQQLVSHGGSVETTIIFSEEELKKATNNYHEDEILGEGGYGTVYKGRLQDNSVVAIKKPKCGAPTQSDLFANEVIILSQINHRNVVKLLGCCFETKEPLLVYEYITNGTLFEHVFTNGKRFPLSWELRLKIASETAAALAYLHSSASVPIIHRDVKTTNILLDENCTAKVSDFGASRFIPLDQTQLATLVQGTLGYLDPEYFHSNQLTDKSDVYSFGVVLAELLTSKVALSFARPDNERCLASFFVSSLKNGRLIQILDADIVTEGNIETVEQVAKLANRCLMIKGDERPTMKEVAMELEGMRAMAKHTWKDGNSNLEETEYLLGSNNSAAFSIVDIGSGGDGGSSVNNTAGYDSMQIQMLMPYDDGR